MSEYPKTTLERKYLGRRDFISTLATFFLSALTSSSTVNHYQFSREHLRNINPVLVYRSKRDESSNSREITINEINPYRNFALQKISA